MAATRTPATRVPACHNADRRLHASSGSTAGQLEADVLADLRGALLGTDPVEETHSEAVLAAADLRVELGVGRQRDAHQLAAHGAVDLVLEHAARGEFVAPRRGLARQPEQLSDGVAQGL